MVKKAFKIKYYVSRCFKCKDTIKEGEIFIYFLKSFKVGYQVWHFECAPVVHKKRFINQVKKSVKAKEQDLIFSR